MYFIFYKNIKKASLFTTFLLVMKTREVNPFLSWIKNRKVSNCLSVVFSTNEKILKLEVLMSKFLLCVNAKKLTLENT